MGLSDRKKLVREDIISSASLYSRFLDHTYLLCSSAFRMHPYYILEFAPENFKHLVGVRSSLRADEFFLKAYDGSLSEKDFEFIREGYDEKEALRCARDKLSVFPCIVDIFTDETIVEENFDRNQIKCLFAVGESTCTMGFTKNNPARPMTLLKGNKLNPEKSGPLELVLCKKSTSDLFDEIVLGDDETLSRHYSDISHLLSPDIRPKM